MTLTMSRHVSCPRVEAYFVYQTFEIVSYVTGECKIFKHSKWIEEKDNDRKTASKIINA